MRSFEFYNPTRIHFGPGKAKQVVNLLQPVVNKGLIGDRGLLIHGSDRVRRTGLLDDVLGQLAKAGLKVETFGGVRSNPRLSTLERAVKRAMELKATVVIALGGGSVMDLAKAAAAGVMYDGPLWDMVFHGQEPYQAPERALPIITVPTLAATGSEMDPIAVITNEETGQKSFIRSEALYPTVSIVDPLLTVSVPADQTAYGVSDMISHVTETWFNGPDDIPIQVGMAETVVKTALSYGARAIENGQDIEARTQLQWAAIVALNGWVQAGADAPFPVHAIEHALSAWYNIPHGAGLAVLNPAWMQWAARLKPEKFITFAKQVFGVSGADASTALTGIMLLKQRFGRFGLPVSLKELGVPQGDWQGLAESVLQTVGRKDRDGKRYLPAITPMYLDDILDVFKLASQ